MDILITNSDKFLKTKIKKYSEIKSARKQMVICKYLLGLVTRDTPVKVYQSTGFYGKCECGKCKNEVFVGENFCKICGSRLEW